jgi:DNA-binding transcriptional MerR regulator
MDLLKLSTISEKLNLPESTVRYHAKKFSRFIPFVVEGKQRRYKPEAMEILRVVAEMMKNNNSTTEVESYLSTHFPINIESETQENNNATTMIQKTTTTQQQLDLASNFKELLDLHIEIIKQSTLKDKALLEQNATIAQQRNEIEQKNKEIEELKAMLIPWWNRLWKR